jgi:hypothetical protein
MLLHARMTTETIRPRRSGKHGPGIGAWYARAVTGSIRDQFGIAARARYHGGMIRILIASFLSICTGCATSGTASMSNPWAVDFAPPQSLGTRSMFLVPLKPEHAELDYAAFMSSREHLRRTLDWGGWPSDDATVEENRTDLERHWREHRANEAYTYAVLSPDGTRSLGCVYLKPLPSGENVPEEIAGLQTPGVRIAYWVVESSLPDALDRHLVQQLTHWLRNEWGMQSILMPIHMNNPRGIEIAKDFGYDALPRAEGEQRINFVWRRKR